MPSKYCSTCGDLVTCSSQPNYCCWCGCDLRQEPLTPPFNSFKGRLKVIAEAAAKATPQPKEEITPGRYQIKLF